MNSANFHDYIKNPSMLHQVSYQELKSLTLLYPYAINLRYLLLIKSLLDNNREHERNLVMASLASIDRRKLQQLAAQFKPDESALESFALDEDFLELRDLNALEDVPAEKNAPPAEMMAETPLPNVEDTVFDFGETQSDGPIFEDSDDLSFLEGLFDEDDAPAGENIGDEEGQVFEESEEALPPEAETEDMPAASPEPPAREAATDLEELKTEEEEGIIEEEFSIHDLLAGMPQSEAATEEAEEVAEEIEKEEKGLTFESPEEGPADTPSLDDLHGSPPPAPASWLNRVKKPQKGFVLDDLSDLSPASKKPKKEKTKRPTPKETAKKVATKSILEDADIATETLAGLLERQGYHEKAIEMYERLKLKFPEKSSFFAAKIETLKNKK